MTYLLLATSIFFEVVGTSLIKKTNGFTNLIPTIGTILCYGVSFYLVSIVVKIIPVGIVYATWSASGIVLVTLAAYFIYNQKPDLPAVIGTGLIILGVVVINLFSKMSAH